MTRLLTLALLVLPAMVQADQATAMKSGCIACHQMAVKTVGPSIKDISAKYAAGDVDKLIQSVKQGSAATGMNWGAVPMPPSPAPEADVRKVVEWMVSQ